MTKKLLFLLALLCSIGVQAQVLKPMPMQAQKNKPMQEPAQEPVLLFDMADLPNSGGDDILGILSDGTKLYFHQELEPNNSNFSGYFYLILYGIESEAQTLSIPSDYFYHGYSISLKRVLIEKNNYKCNLQHITVPEGTEVFYLLAADSLVTLTLPSTMVGFNFPLADKFTDLYLNSVYPPYWGSSSKYDSGFDQPMNQPLTGVTIHVPSMAMGFYSETAPYKDGNLVVKEEPVEHLYVGYQPDITIQNTDGLADNASLTVPRWYVIYSFQYKQYYNIFYVLSHNYDVKYDKQYYGMVQFYPARLTIDADKPIKLQKFRLDQDCNEYKFPNYTDPLTQTNYKITPSTAIFHSPVTAEEVEMTYHMFRSHSLRWKGGTASDKEMDNFFYFVSFPFDVKISDITFPDLQIYGEVFCLEFDGEKHAASLGAGYWCQLSKDEMLHANRGYLISFLGKYVEKSYISNYNETTLHVRAMDTENKQQIFANGDVAVPVTPYPSKYNHREGWNLIGNPYPCFFDIHYMDFTAPITVFDGFNYYAFSPLDDDYYLYPNEAFFVQCPEGVSSITFRKDGRLHEDPKGLWQLKKSPARAMRQASEASSERRVYNIILTGEAGSDRTRIVINEQASTDYELEHDAAKMMGQESVPQLYVQDGGVQYAIDERPLEDGIFSLGMIIPEEGSYTLSLNSTTDEQTSVVLTDLLTGKEVDLTQSAYTFDAAAGSTATRFRLRMGENVETRFQDVNADSEVSVYYDLQGRIIPSTPTQSGVYILRQGQTINKVIVK